MTFVNSPGFISFKPTKASIPPVSVVLRQQDPKGLPVHIYPLNPISFLLRAAQIYPDKLAVAHPDVEHPVYYSFSIWAQRIQNLAYALLEAGVQPGDRVAILAPNCPMILDAYFGVIAARAVITPINTRLKASEIEYILDHSGAELLLVDHELAHLVKKAKTLKRVIVCRDTGRDDDPYEQFLNSGRVFSQEQGWLGLERESNEDTSCVLCYTSGTTGRPKGVITTLRGSYLSAIANATECEMTKKSTYLWILPMFHAAGWTFPWASVIALATQITLRAVNYTHIWNHLLHSDVTHYCGAPTVQIGIVNHHMATKISRTVIAVVAGAAPTAHLISELEMTGITPVHVYGLTETYGPFTRCYTQGSWVELPLTDRARLMARQGHSYVTASPVRVVFPPRHENDVELVDVPKDGKTVGEVIMCGNIVMKEYFRDPEATKKAFRGGCFASGDLAVMHSDGSLAIVDRAKDIIISGGENSSSLAIEQELSSHPHVLEVSVIARKHEKWGERPHAFVVLHPQHCHHWESRWEAFTAELKAHAKKLLPGFAVPEWITVVKELPKTSTGKIQKMTLRQTVAKL